MENAHSQALAAMPAGDVEYILSQLRSEEPRRARSRDVVTDPGSGKGGDDEEARRRRHIEREWPEAGAVLSSGYYGATYTAEIIPAAKRLKSGRQIRVTSGPAKGTICDSFSEAMLAATEKQRADQDLGRKGVSNGWLFWEWPGKPTDIAGDDAEEISS